MKTLQTDGTLAELLDRISHLTPEAPPLWGRMTAPQMVRHLLDSFDLVLGKRAAADVSTFASRHLVKHLALRLPVEWPKGVPTRPEVDQEIGGTKPGDFSAETDQLRGVLTRFAALPRDHSFSRHPMFATMTAWEWQRWAWLHTDHHLRQFGR